MSLSSHGSWPQNNSFEFPLIFFFFLPFLIPCIMSIISPMREKNQNTTTHNHLGHDTVVGRLARRFVEAKKTLTKCRLVKNVFVDTTLPSLKGCKRNSCRIKTHIWYQNVNVKIKSSLNEPCALQITHYRHRTRPSQAGPVLTGLTSLLLTLIANSQVIQQSGQQ